eukprot:Nitzschia sp. Nitz4//scaffold92_size79448//57089//57607//NITZ4_005397-RA/size79448-processed-gene-0.59-mRNA-1//1//CDS//3329560204//5907//frame0
MLARKSLPIISRTIGKSRTTGKVTACMQRHFSSSSSEPPKPSLLSNVLIGIGWTLLGLTAIDQALQYKQDLEEQEQRKQVFEYLKQEEDKAQGNSNTSSPFAKSANLPTLFSCRVTRTEASLDGNMILPNVQVGDVVQVVETPVGPDKTYHLCRTSEGQMGWYPIRYLQQVK